MTTPALQKAEDLQTVAALLSEIADNYNARLRAEAANLTTAQVFVRLQEEQRLRSLANQMHFEANDLILDDVVDDQSRLESSLSKAKKKVKQFEDFARALDLVADILVLAGAILAGKPGPIIASLKEVREDITEAKAGTLAVDKA
jgi:hypothetical protein